MLFVGDYMDMLPINEMFISFQGEGPFVGTPAYFIRVSGCNCNCDFCDTDFKNYELRDIEDILLDIWDNYHYNGIKNIIFTGGEPTLYYEQIQFIIDEIKEFEPLIRFHIESNGLNNIYFNNAYNIISPKKDIKNVFKKYYKCNNVYFKFVITSQEDIDNVIYLKEKYNYDRIIYLQPESSNATEITNLIIENFKNIDNIKISIQSHKFVGAR